ncbi:hypothetical protein PIB30_009507 [Stylosanthes scabra]|uniref:RING-type E3 ubiquitin transferase n=1 Tax=Stylosanthes scabra TaxID=79078 RepID=A0ABU6Y3A8_9FABA|nr:hypothetical protein [Stylosanthes scabra]
MRVVTTTTVAEEHMKGRRPRKQHMMREETDPRSARCKSSISSLLLSTFSNNNNDGRKKSNFSAAGTLRGLGCTAGASQEVSVPAVIRSSAEWEGKKVRKKKHKGKGGGGVDFQHVSCSSRPKIDVHKINQRQAQVHAYSSSCLGRRSLSVNPETISLLDTHPTHLFTPPSASSHAYYRHLPDPHPHPQIMMLEGGGTSILMAGRGRLTTHDDQFRDWRLDVDNMSYEQLLELGDRIGHVNTGLKENEMGGNITYTKLQISDDQADKTCTICQEEYEAGDELGRLHCDHTYHFHCIKQWVAHKNFCPVCKQQVLPRNANN